MNATSQRGNNGDIFVDSCHAQVFHCNFPETWQNCHFCARLGSLYRFWWKVDTFVDFSFDGAKEVFFWYKYMERKNEIHFTFFFSFD